MAFVSTKLEGERRKGRAKAAKASPKPKPPAAKAAKVRTPAWLRKCRERLGMTQAELAGLLSVDVNTIYRKERTDGKAVAITPRDEKTLTAEFTTRGLVLPR